MFEVPESDIICVKINEDVILGKKPIEFVRRAASNDNKDSEQAGNESEKLSSENLDNGEQESKAKTYA